HSLVKTRRSSGDFFIQSLFDIEIRLYGATLRNAGDGTSGTSFRPRATARPASCRRRGVVWPLDDRGIGTARLQDQSRHALSDAPYTRTQGLFDLTHGKGGPVSTAHLQSHALRHRSLAD